MGARQTATLKRHGIHTSPHALGGRQRAAHDEQGAEDAADQLREDVGEALQDRDVAGDHGGDGDGRGDVAAAEVRRGIDCAGSASLAHVQLRVSTARAWAIVRRGSCQCVA